MSLDDEMDNNYEQVRNALCKTGAIKDCYCDSFYWTINDNPYAFVFSFLKKNNIDMDGNYVKQTIKEIIEQGGNVDDECPHCGWRINKKRQ